ncbi:MAPEG family protein [Dyella subtropica]|uniref:MAPEG family protein n=1 Tax=Dyella subtropica TaxID=2992127 RepID=UPI00225922B0|nr:MAPEG family protein [Dyella subtropica]
MSQHLPALVVLLAVALQFGTAFAVGRARVRCAIKAPATNGHPDFERAFRVQMNTLESVLMFLPSLWLAVQYGSALWAGVAGLVWVMGRTWYALGYLKEARKREGGFLLGSIGWLVTLAIGVIGLARAMFVG